MNKDNKKKKSKKTGGEQKKTKNPSKDAEKLFLGEDINWALGGLEDTAAKDPAQPAETPLETEPELIELQKDQDEDKTPEKTEQPSNGYDVKHEEALEKMAGDMLPQPEPSSEENSAGEEAVLKEELPVEQEEDLDPVEEELPSANHTSKTSNIKQWLFIGNIAILAVLLILSVRKNNKLSNQIADIKSKAISNARTAKKLIIEKDKLMEERKPLKNKTTKLTRELRSARNTTAGLKQQNEAIKDELDSTKDKFVTLQNKVKQYAEEVKKMAVQRMTHYSAYLEERKNREQLTQVVSGMKTKIENLNSELDTIGERYISLESDYVYKMAFLYAQAGMFNESIKSFEHLIDLLGDDPDIYYNLALLYDKVKRDASSAVKYYRLYLSLNPNATDLYEINMRIDSLSRGSLKDTSTATLRNFKIDMNKMKF